MASAPRELDRPAFYALRSGGWRDLITLLHPPYTAWHLSYIALGAAAAPLIHADRLAPAPDELQGHPLQTRLSDRTLIGLAVVGLAGAVAIGVAGVLTVSVWLAPPGAPGGLLGR